MSYPRVLFFSILLLLSLPSAVLAQEPQREDPVSSINKLPGRLEDLMAIALRNNPEILKAMALVRQAEAELNQVRLQVAQQLSELHHHQVQLESKVRQAQQALKHAQELFDAGALSTEEVAKAESSLQGALIGLAEQEARLRYVLGQALFSLAGCDPEPGGASLQTSTGGAQADPSGSTISAAIPTPPSVPEIFQKALQTPVKVDFQGAPLYLVVESLAAQSGIPMIFDQNVWVMGEEGTGPDLPFTLKLGAPLPLEQALQAIADQGEFAFVIRSYGILVTDRTRAADLEAVSIPKLRRR